MEGRPDLTFTITLEMAEDAEEFIRQIVRQEIATHMERVVRYRGWGPAAATTPRYLRTREVSMPAREEQSDG